MPRGNSSFTREQRDAYAKAAATEGVGKIAKRAKVHQQTVYAWIASLRERQKAAHETVDAQLAATPNGNGKANGHAPPVTVTVHPSPQVKLAEGIDAFEAQLEDTLKSVRAMRASFRSVFGG